MKPGQHRETARVLLHNAHGEVFLLHTHFDPEVGLAPRWITPGGGIDEGETPKQAALRELREETGLELTKDQIGEEIWRTSGTWFWGDGLNQHTYVDYFFAYAINDFVLDDSGWTTDERRDVLEYRWWNVSDLIASGEQFGPHGLAEFLQHHFQR